MIYVLLAEGNYRITVKSRMLKRKSEKIAGLPIWIAFSYEVTPFTFRECKGCREMLMKSDIVKKFF